MPRLNDANAVLANEIIGRYPRARSALIPLLHLAQEQDGYVSDEAIAHIAELVGVSSAQVLGTCTFYEMFKREPVGRYLVNVCTNISCMLLGADELLHHAEESLGIKAGDTTEDGLITLHGAECIAACTEAPCLQVNYRYEYRVDPEGFDRLVEDLRGGTRVDLPSHGTLGLTRQHIPDDRRAGVVPPEDTRAPVWMRTATQDGDDA